MTKVTNINEILDSHVSLKVECVDRLLLNAYVPNLQVSGQVVTFLTRPQHRMASEGGDTTNLFSSPVPWRRRPIREACDSSVAPTFDRPRAQHERCQGDPGLG